mmetsp:Transcript_109232/g.319754  ORF Transcript_109232/g.319754 Transcript_109232/m.319754 type:complete len:854 (+) Transcript_109232:79-2640(+)
MPDPDERICDGLLFPLVEAEHAWNKGLRAVLYAAAMVYLFLGVSIIADKFVSGIEVITSRQRRTVDKRTGRVITTVVWNDTVANLTLLALGSSAPEILLAIMESIRRGFTSGELGPSTIVGSAAFNLFMIIAVCIVAIPSPETRRIKQYAVFVVTAIFSLLAYLWLVFIVQVSSVNRVDIWEAVVTLLMLPVLVFVSYAADVGWWPFRLRTSALERWVDDIEQPAGRGGQDQDLPCTHGALPDGPSPGVPGCVDEVWAEPFTQEGRRRLSGAGGGVLAFDDDMWEVVVGSERRRLSVPVLRRQGSDGLAVCRCRTEGRSAVPGRDYVEYEGELRFAPGVTQVSVNVELLPKRPGDESCQFGLVLDDVRGGALLQPGGGPGAPRGEMVVTILGESDGIVVHGSGCGVIDVRRALRDGIVEWFSEIMEAVSGADEENEPWTMGDWIYHLLSVPWQFVFSILVPPAGWMGGWLCFGTSLMCIGGVTSIVIDFAELFGCVTSIDDSITAITFVALGTSMPDLFASVSAARNDEWADASIVNVTGSNSVNVFVGIGIPWTMSAVYWSTQPEGTFTVQGDNLAFSVVVFSVAALMALAVIRLRRVKFGGELGGPLGPKILSALLMVLLWVFYISLSIWKVVTQTEAFWSQAAAVFIGVVILEHIMMFAGVGYWLCCDRTPSAEPASSRRGTAPQPPANLPPQLFVPKPADQAKLVPAPIVCGSALNSQEAPVQANCDQKEMPPSTGQPPQLMSERIMDGAAVPSAEALFADAISFASAAIVILTAKRLQRRVRSRSQPDIEQTIPRSMLFRTQNHLLGDDKVVQLVGAHLSELVGAHKTDCMALSYMCLRAAHRASGRA